MSRKQLQHTQGVARGQYERRGLLTSGLGVRPHPMARAECREGREDPGPIFLGHWNVGLRGPWKRGKRPRGERGLSKVTTMLATQLRGLGKECF